MTEGSREPVDAPASPDGTVDRRRHQATLDALDAGVFEVDADGRFVAVNEAFRRLVDADAGELDGEHVSSVLHADDADRIEAALRRGSDDGRLVDVALRTTGDGFLPREVRVECVEAQEADAAAICVVRGPPADDEDDAVDEREATQRRDATGLRVAGASDPAAGGEPAGWSTSAATEDSVEQRPPQGGEGIASLWETYRSLSSVVDEAEVGVFVLDRDLHVAWVDATVERYFGVDRSELIGREQREVVRDTIRDRVAEPEAFEDSVLATYEDNDDTARFECLVVEGPDREERWLEHHSKPIETGQFAGGRVELYYDVTARRESDETRQQREQFSSLVDAVTEYAIFLLDEEGRIATWNPGAERIKGYEADEIVGRHFSQFYTERERLACVPEHNVARAIEHGSAEDEGWRLRADGSRFWANVTITTIRDDAGEITGFAKVTRDMTDRREREQALQRERDLVDSILETSPVGIALVSEDGSVERANDRMAELFGVRPDAIDEYSVGDRDLFDETGGLLPAAERPPGRVFETGEPVFDQEVRVERPGSEDRWLTLHAAPIAADDGDPEQVVASATDVTHIKELAEERKRALRERENALATVELATELLEPDDRPVGDLIVDLAGELRTHFRFPDETVARVRVGDERAVAGECDDVAHAIEGAARAESGTPVAVEVRRSADISAETHGEFLAEEQELVDTLATLLTFHVDRREYVRDLRAETERLEQFAYAASHDMQEPLRMVSSYLQLLERRYADDLDDDAREYIGFAVDGAERMHDMIDGLLAYSRVETRGEPFEPVDLDCVLADVLDDLQFRIEETGADVSTSELPVVEGDADQLRQVLQNLLENALKYSGDAPPAFEVGAERAGDRWRVWVADDGPGIETDHAEEIFDVFERLHGRDEHDGTGIGLALCERIVERHGGDIWVDSEPGEGATFSFTVPATEEA